MTNMFSIDLCYRCSKHPCPRALHQRSSWPSNTPHFSISARKPRPPQNCALVKVHAAELEKYGIAPTKNNTGATLSTQLLWLNMRIKAATSIVARGSRALSDRLASC